MVAPNREVSNTTPTDSTHDHHDQREHAIDPSDIWKVAADDRAKQIADRTTVSDRTSTAAASSERVIVDPNQLIKGARDAGKEMAGLLQQGLSSDKTITVKNSEGRDVQMTVGDRVTQLRETINKDCQLAIVGANELVKSKPNLDSDLNSVTAQIQTAAARAGLDVNDPTFRQKAAQNSDLAPMLEQQQKMQSERMAPGTAMLTYAMLKAEGLTDQPQQSMENFKQNGVPKPTQQEMNDAFLLVSQAGRTNQEVFHSPLYAATNNAIKTDYAVDQTQKGQQIVKLIQQADTEQQSGSSSKAGELYKQAWQMGEGIDQKFLIAQLKLQDNQSNPAVAQELLKSLSNVKEARMHYANYLVNNGDAASALPIALKVAADTPAFADQDPTFNQLVSKATFGSNMTAGEFSAHQAKFASLMQDANNPNRFTEAQTELTAMQTSFAKTKETIDAGKPKLEEEKKALDDKLADLAKKKDSTDPDEFKIEQTRLQHEKDVIDGVEKANDQMMKQGTYLKYLDGVLNMSQENRDKAHACFEEVKKEDPELAKNPALNLDQLLEQTKHQNFFQRNWKAIATGVAVVGGLAAGLLVGAATGPGGILAGVGTTTAIMGALGAGATVGAIGYTGTKGLTLGFDKVTWDDAKDGALIGGMAAVPMTRVGALLAPEGAGLAGLANVGGSSAIARFGLAGKSLAWGAGFAAADEGYNVAVHGEDLKSAATNFGVKTAFNTVGFYTAGRATSLLGVAGSASLYKGGEAVVNLGTQTYADITAHTLNPNDANENKRIWDNYNSVDPSLYAPDAVVAPVKAQPQEQTQAQPAVRQPQELSEDEIARRRNEEITDEPVGK